MNRRKWIYISHKGEQHKVSVLHSPKLGHLLILVNSKMALADKKVFGQDSYTFFIDDELCIIDVLTVEGKFQYDFRFNLTAETELNKTRKKNSKKNVLYSLSTFGGLFTIVGTLIVVITIFQDTQKWKSVRDYGVVSVANVEIIELQNKFSIFYYYRDSLQYIGGTIGTYKDANPILKNGFPIQNDDAFLVTYSNKIKTNNKIHLDYPTPKTVQRYRQLAATTYLKNHTDVSTNYCDCVLDIAYEMKNWQGLALVYNEKTSSETHERFNQKKYQEWIASDAFLDKEVDCWSLK